MWLGEAVEASLNDYEYVLFDHVVVPLGCAISVTEVTCKYR